MNQSEREKNFEEFLHGLERCPICGNEMVECNNVLIKKVRNSSRLMTCSICEILIGRYT